MELQSQKQWICWEARERGGKTTKVPVYPNTRKDISIKNQNNWLTFEDAVASCERYNLSGIGFVFTSDDPYLGIDIDKCVEEQGDFSPLALRIIQQANSYTEFSPSGRGVHIICKGILPKGRNKNENHGLEMYDQNRYFTFTGSVVSEYVQVNDRTGIVIDLYNKYLATEQKIQERREILGHRVGEIVQWNMFNDGTLEILSKMKNNQNILALYDGRWEGLYQSQNQADLALCNALAFATGRDIGLMDRVYRGSALYRKKWDEIHYSGGITYGDATLRKAVDGCTSVYEPSYNKQLSQPVISQEPRQEQHQKQLPIWYEKDFRSGSVKFMAGVLARHLRETIKVIYMDGCLHQYNNGIYFGITKDQAKSIVQERLIDKYMKSSYVKDAYDLWRTSLVELNEGLYKESNSHVINFQNGLFNTRTKELVPHSTEYVSIVQLNCSYDVGADCPKFLQFISDTLQPEVVPIIQELLGYLLVPVTKAQKAFIFYGPGRTGKSTLLRVIEAIIGQKNISNVPWQDLEGRFNKATLYGKQVNIGADLPAKELMETATFKSLTGEDVIHAEFKGKDAFSFRNEARLVFSCNQLPQNDVDRTDGFYRRLLIIPFFNQVEEHQVNPYLVDQLIDEVDGIVQWALKGLERLATNDYRFSPSELTKQMLEGYKVGGDSVKWFVKEHCELSEEKKTYSQNFYNCYVQSCRANGIKPKSIAQFVQEIETYCGKSITRILEAKTKRAIIKGICYKEDAANQVA